MFLIIGTFPHTFRGDKNWYYWRDIRTFPAVSDETSVIVPDVFEAPEHDIVYKSCLWPRWQRTSGHFYPGLWRQNQMFSPEPSGSCVWTWPEHKLSVSPHHLHTFCFCSNGLSCVFPAWNLDLTYVLFTFCTCWVVLSVQVEDGAAERTETVLKLGRTVKYLACIEACCCELSSRRQQLL